VIKPRELIEAETKVWRLRQKLGEYLDDFFKGFAKSAGEEAGKQAVRWIALLGALTYLLDAVRSWPH
jgi:hypothetical protein